MLRNTSDGNELAMPLPMPLKEHSIDPGILCRLDWRQDLGYYVEGVPEMEPSRSLRSLVGNGPSPSIDTVG